MGILVECQKWMDKNEQGEKGMQEWAETSKMGHFLKYKNLFSRRKHIEWLRSYDQRFWISPRTHTYFGTVCADAGTVCSEYAIKQRTVIVITLFILMVLCVFVPKIVIRFRWFSFIRAKVERECVAVLVVMVVPLLLLRQMCHFIWFLVSHDTC